MTMETETFTCDFCGFQFTLEQGRHECHKCGLFGLGGCQRLQCPRCHYGKPAPARLPQLLKNLRRPKRIPPPKP